VSVGFANAVASGLRYNGVPVSFEPGWDTRGNGFVFPNGRPEGLICHHTGDNYGAGLAILVNGRPDLDPPLCNCCTYPDGRIHIIAAFPANHAGAAAGSSLGPFTPTGLFNPKVWGNEIMYPGVAPMTAAQRRSAQILGGVILGILGKTDTEWVRGHFETSGEGKWDPGVGDGSSHSIDMDAFRAGIWAALTGQHLEDDMAQWPPISLTGTGHRIIPLTVGSVDGYTQKKATLNVEALDVTGPISVEIFTQSDTVGTGHWLFTDKDLKQTADNNYKRVFRDVPSGTTKVIVKWDCTNAVDVALSVETKATV